MLQVKTVRSLLAVLLTLTIALTSFVRPAYAFDGASFFPFWNGVLEGLGGVVGGAVGTVATCYAVDAFIAPVAPPVAVYLAGMCPAIGAAAGGVSGVAGAKVLVEAF
jgi:hypothetical protein